MAMQSQVSLPAVLEAVARYYPNTDLTPVTRAHEYLAKAAVAEQTKALEAARMLADMRMDPPTVAAALVAGARPPEAGQLQTLFGTEIAHLVEGVARLEAVEWEHLEREAAEALRKMFIAMAADVRVVIVVLVRLLLRMRQRDYDQERRQKVARETLEVFAPLANRLGIWQLKSELEDLALRELEPATYAELERLVSEKRSERNAFIQEAMQTLRQKLGEQSIEAVVSGRSKHLYSVYKKMQRKQVGFDQIHDLSAVRIITKRVPDCYASLGLVHSIWVPIPGGFDDYIARPKENLYQSLHTAVVGPGGKRLEVQIRTQEMHHYAEYGVAAHWAYKEGRKAIRAADKKFTILRQLMDWEREVSDPHQFAESLKTDIFKDQVLVFTPRGDIVDMPQGATPLDFAYRIHTMVGHRCRGALVNDQIVPLDSTLKTGDRVEVLTQKQPHPSRDWMNPSFGYLRTASARAKVRQWFRMQGRETAVQEGREIVEKELARLGMDAGRAEELASFLGYDKLEDLFAAVGFGDRSAHSIASSALQFERHKLPPSEPPVPALQEAKPQARPASGISLAGVSDILGKRARCCNPVPGDAVLGYISRGRGMIIHRRDCPQVTEAREPERWVEVDWGPEAKSFYPLEVEIRAHDRPGLLRDLTTLIAQAGANVRAAHAEALESHVAMLRLSLEFTSAEQVARVLERIDAHSDVIGVRRITR